MTVTADDLAVVPLFSSLGESDRQTLADFFEVKTLGEGAQLIGEGASGYSFFVLADGQARVTSKDVEVATLGPGDYFGEMAIIGDGRRLATVTADTAVKVFVMFGTEFRLLQQHHPEIAGQIETLMRERLESLR
jgi:CRP/FNR family transcriptional regulator, cyclic AMP receptor protein